MPLSFVSFASFHPVSAQVNPVTCNIPVVVVQVDPQTHALDLATNLGTADFTAREEGRSALVSSAVLDTSPKRIVLAFDASGRVDKTQWNLQLQLADALITKGHPGDTFSIYLSPGTPSPFTSVEESRKTLRRLLAVRPQVAEKRNPIYDSLLAAIKIFEAPQFGDSVVTIGFGKDGNSKTKPDYVMGALIQEGIRLHTIGFIESGDNLSRTELGIPGAITASDPDEARLFAMSTRSGGTSRTLRRDRSFKDDAIFQQRLTVLYEGIARPYRVTLQLDGSAKPHKLEVASQRAKQVGPGIIILHPTVTVGCPNRASGA
jgi:hypothetical protein